MLVRLWGVTMGISERIDATPVWVRVLVVGVVGILIGWSATYGMMNPSIQLREGEVAELTQERNTLRSDLRSETQKRELAESAQATAERARDNATTALEEREQSLADREADLDQREEAVTRTETAIAAKSFGNGTHRVGEDIKAGTYRIAETTDCYWARLSNGGGGLDGIIANEIVSGSAVVTIAASDWGFESSGCGTWTRTD